MTEKKTGDLWTKEQSLEAYNELMLKIAMSSYAELHGEELKKEEDAIGANLNATVPVEALCRLEKELDKKLRIKKLKIIASRSYKVLNKVALVFLVIAMAFTVTMFVSASARRALYRLVLEYEKEATRITVGENNDDFIDGHLYNFDNAYAPTFMPEGYKHSQTFDELGIFAVIYLNDANGQIVFQQDRTGYESAAYLDTEDADEVRHVLINDSEGMLARKRGETTIVWSVGKTMFMLVCTESTEVALEVARSVTLMS